ncbi:MAG: 30S ribosomal protein S5 [Janthinobacterium sp.]|jgi:small subunit ribosomal protein S5
MVNKRSPKFKTEQPEFEQRLIDVARVTRVMAGGKRMRFRATLAIGDRKGQVGVGLAKGADVTMAIQKAFNQAKKNLIRVPVYQGTVPHQVWAKFNATQVLMKPAKPGAGVKAGGPMRVLFELAGVTDVTAKILGSNNKINIVKATLQAFQSFKPGAVKILKNVKSVETPKEVSAPVKKEIKAKE